MDAIIQFVRNALCCVKDLELGSSILHDPNYTSKYYTFPGPHLNQTTPLEILIAITQLYACISCTISGLKLMWNQGLMKLKKLAEIIDTIKDKLKNDKVKKSKKTTSLVQESMMNEANQAMKNIFVGICVAATGITFFWLAGNSFHITEAGWIGGLPALIYALIVAEIALIPLLYYMLKDASSKFSKARKIGGLVQKYNVNKNKEKKDDDTWIDLDTFVILQGDQWTPCWTLDNKVDEKILTKDIEAVETKVKVLTTSNSTILSDDLAQQLQRISLKCKMEGYIDYVYFILNFVAFYGYMLGVLCYYFDKEEDQHYVLASIKFGATNEVADWTGNFAGDLMWTIEPIIILLSPVLLSRMITQEEKRKLKSD